MKVSMNTVYGFDTNNNDASWGTYVYLIRLKESMNGQIMAIIAKKPHFFLPVFGFATGMMKRLFLFDLQMVTTLWQKYWNVSPAEQAHK